ncbi:MAG: toll/interleukin-1 receptor domain-containing protein [Planctomycetota bacterium]
MKVFLTHAAKDELLAAQLASRLTDGGIDVLTPYEDIVPGDNWAEKVAHALDDSELMLILLTPGAMQSDSLRKDIDYGLSSKKFRGRLMTVFVGAAAEAPGDVPWILLQQRYQQLRSSADFPEVVDELTALAQ